MKKMIHRFIALLLTVLLTVGMVVPASAASPEPNVMFNGSTREIEFRNANPFKPGMDPDLFPDLKNMMPGDARSQTITVGARKMGMDSVRIWLRAENPNEDYIKLLETYGHWVKFTVSNGDQEITGDLSDGVLLGTFEDNGKTTVKVDLSIDILADNNLQNLVAEIDWVFTAELIPSALPAPDIDGDDLPWLTDDHINYIIGYEDNTVRPNASITRAEVATIFYRLLTDEARDEMFCTESIYPDVLEDDWFYVAVCTLTKGGILEGYPNGNFAPNDPISRAELATIICRFDTKFGKIQTTASFKDVKQHWAKDEVEFAATRGYVIGYPDGKFYPDQKITRAETVTMVNRCLQRAVDEDGLLDEYIDWPDNLPGAWYYYEIIEAANYHDYDRSNREIEGWPYTNENWEYLHDPIDWACVEEQWIKIYTGRE